MIWKVNSCSVVWRLMVAIKARDKTTIASLEAALAVMETARSAYNEMIRGSSHCPRRRVHVVPF